MVTVADLGAFDCVCNMTIGCSMALQSDLTEARATLEDEALADFARTNNYLAAVTCSSKSGDNVVEVVEIMATAVLEQGDSNESVGGQAGGLTLRKEEETKCCDF